MKSGWNQQVIEWFTMDARRRELKPHEYCGGLIVMKIQVGNHRLYSNTTNTGLVTQGSSNYYNILYRVA